MKKRLPQRIRIVPLDRKTLNEWATKYHYMHRPVHQKACPFGWGVEFDGNLYQPDGKPSGFVMYASVHFTKLGGEFGYPDLPTKWQVLSLARLWLHDNLPRNSESCTVAKTLRAVQQRWLEVHPPKWPDEPYEVLKIISYCEMDKFLGTIYKATNFRDAGRTISRKRHKNSRGPGMEGSVLARFIYDLRERPKRHKWKEPLQARLGL